MAMRQSSGRYSQHMSKKKSAKESLKTRNTELEALYRLSLEVNAQRDLPTLLRWVVKQAADLLNAHMGGLYLLRPDGESLELVVSYNLGKDFTGLILKIGEGLSGKIAQTRKIEMVDDYQVWEGRAHIYEGYNFRRVLGVPLMAGDRLIGVINITDDQHTGLFNEDEVRLVKMFADQAALAVENARLYDLAQRKEDAIQAILKGTVGVGETFFRSLVTSLAHALRMRFACVIEIIQDEPSYLRTIACYKDGQIVENFECCLSSGANESTADPSMEFLEHLREKFPEFSRFPEIRAENYLKIPLLNAGGNCLGFLVVINDQPIVDVKLSETLLPIFASRAAVELERMQAERSLQRRDAMMERRAAQLALLNDTGSRIAAVLEPQMVLERAASLIHNLFGYHHVGIFLLEDEWLEMRARAGEMSSRFPSQHRLQIGQGIVGWTASTQQSHLANDVARDPHYINKFPEWLNTKSELSVPIRVGGNLLGVLDLQSPELDAFDFDDILVMETLADQVAVALENARLFQAVQNELAAHLRTQQALEASQEHLRHVVTNIPIVLFSIDNKGIFRLSEGKGLELLGLKPGQMVGQSVFEVYREYPDLCNNITKALQGNAFATNVVVGDLVFETLYSPQFNDLGEVIGVIGISNNVTDRIQADRERQQQQAYMTLLHQITKASLAAPDTQQLLQFAADHLGEIIHADVCFITRWDEEKKQITPAAVSQPFDVLMDAPSWKAGEPTLSQAVLDSGHSLAVTDICDSPYDTQGLFARQGLRSVLALPLIASNRKLGAALLVFKEEHEFSNIEIQHCEQAAAQVALALHKSLLLEESRQRAEELQNLVDALHNTQARLIQSEKLAAIGELVSGVAHELNNPLSSVVLFAQLLQDKKLDPDAKADLDHIISEALRAARIVRGLLDFARQRPVEKRPSQVNDLLYHSLDLVAYELRTHNIQWQLHLSPEIPITLLDPHQIQQVFINLINNAWQAMSAERGRGLLTIRTSLVNSPSSSVQPKRQPAIRISFQDDGPGIPQDLISRIFDPFFTTKPDGKGTGLGLSICHGIISEHGGQIWAESRPGDGATFIIELPIVQIESVSNSGSPPISDSQDSKPKARLLLVDDEPILLDVMARALKRRGLYVDKATSGEQALLLISQSYFDLIICDIRLPDLSGPEIYRQALLSRPELASKFLFTTGDIANAQTRRFIESNQIAYITKPFDLNALIERVLHFLHL